MLDFVKNEATRLILCSSHIIRLKNVISSIQYHQKKTISGNKHYTWWLYVVLFAFLLNGCRNYSSGSGIALESHCYVSAHRLNLRECAGTTCRIITVLKRGTGGVVLQEWWDWIEIDVDGRDLTGWVSARYLTTDPVNSEDDKQQISHKNITVPEMPDEEFAQ